MLQHMFNNWLSPFNLFNQKKTIYISFQLRKKHALSLNNVLADATDFEAIDMVQLTIHTKYLSFVSLYLYYILCFISNFVELKKNLFC